MWYEYHHLFLKMKQHKVLAKNFNAKPFLKQLNEYKRSLRSCSAMNGRQHFLYINVSDDPNDTSEKTAKWISSACLQFSSHLSGHWPPFHHFTLVRMPMNIEHTLFIRCLSVAPQFGWEMFSTSFTTLSMAPIHTQTHEHEELIFCELHLLLLKCRKWDGYEFVLGHNRLSRRHIRLLLALHPLRCLFSWTAAAKSSERTYSFCHRHRAWGLCVCSVGSSSY